MRIFLSLLFVLAIALIIVGLWVDLTSHNPIYHKFYGSGAFLFFLIWMPLFLFSRRDKTKLKNLFNPTNKQDDEHE